MENHLGRLLEPDEVVHHINGDKFDNRIENLEVMTNSEHVSLHHYDCLIEDDTNIRHTFEYYDKLYNEPIREEKNKIREKTNWYKLKYRIKNNECVICGNPCVNLYCSTECLHKDQMKAERPSKEELLVLILENPFTHIGKMYGVSDNAIRKWCKSYGLPYKKNDIKEIIQKESRN